VGERGVTNLDEETTCIRGADWVVAYDQSTRQHIYLRDADVAFAGGKIVHVGRYAGPSQREISGAGRLVLPGLVNVHGHLGTEPLGKGFYEELGNHDHYMSRLYEYIYAVRPPDAATRRAATRLAIAELLLSGATTVADMSLLYDGWQECCAETGARVYLTPMFKSASWTFADGRRVVYEWDAAAGERGLAEALALIEDARRHPSGRLDGIVMPTQVDTCTPELLCAAADAARRRGLPLQIHAGQSVLEFHEMIRRHGKTAVAFLAELGVLGPGTTLSHGIFLDCHPWLHWHEQHDLDILAETGTTIAHCPTVFAYRGVMLHDFGRYRRTGVGMAMGCDTYPHNMAEEMRLALFTAKLSRGHVDYTRTSDVFHAATIGGATALGREDLGRIAVGAAADMTIVDLNHPTMQPCRDPLRSFIFSAGDRAVRDVFVAGRQIIADRRHLTIDVDAALRDLKPGHAQAMREVPTRDWAKRDADTMSPLSLPTMQ
jgi:5-methylthioadenosine/S-adenosylhomocysteine deaminase